MFLLGRHLGFPSSPRYLELADSANYYIGLENWQRAEEKLLEALRLEPANFSNSQLLANLGTVQSFRGEYEKALESFTLGLNIAPSSTVLLNNRAHAYLQLDQTEKAKDDLDKSLCIDSSQQWPLQMRAFIYLQEGDLDKANESFNSLKERFPENPSVYSGLAAIAEGRKEWTSAKNYYVEALRLDPSADDIREAYILFLINTNEYQEARNEIREALTLNPENPMYYLLRGYLHRLNYRQDEALADKKIAISKGLDAEYVAKFIP